MVYILPCNIAPKKLIKVLPAGLAALPVLRFKPFDFKKNMAIYVPE
jgi:hypothetical protein